MFSHDGQPAVQQFKDLFSPEAVVSRQQFLDAPGGDTISYVTVTDDGYRLCPFVPSDDAIQSNFNNLPNKKCRDDDILLCSYPKTGTNWLWEMINMLLEKSSKVSGRTKAPGMLEAMPEEMQDTMPSPRILNTHVKFKYLPKEARVKKIKCVLLCRNPKDTAVSFYNHTKGFAMYQYDGKFENFLQMFMRGEVDYGSYPEYLLEWQHAIRDNTDWPIHVVYYEDMKKDCFTEMKKLTAYLSLDIEDDLLREIVDSCRMDKLKQDKINNLDAATLEALSKVSKGDFTIYRKGIIGDWKNWFTVAKSELFEKWWKDSTEGLDMFQFRYT